MFRPLYNWEFYSIGARLTSDETNGRQHYLSISFSRPLISVNVSMFTSLSKSRRHIGSLLLSAISWELKDKREDPQIDLFYRVIPLMFLLISQKFRGDLDSQSCDQRLTYAESTSVFTVSSPTKTSTHRAW